MDKKRNRFEVDPEPQERGDEDKNPNESSDEPSPDDKPKGFDTPVTTPAEHQGDARRITMQAQDDMRRLRKRGRIGAQEQEPGDKPDIKRPPDADIPEFNDDVPRHPESPPFTGEDVEDIPRPEPSRDQPVM